MAEIRVRMYRQGFGDCFLLTLPGADGEPRHMLIDCGVHNVTKGGSAKLREVARSIEEETKGVIDYLVVTHEHWDHVSGFIRAHKIFDKIKIKNVWVAWTEDPTNDLANELRGRREETFRMLQAVLPRLREAPEAAVSGSRRHVESALGFFVQEPDQLGAAASPRSTADGMRWAVDHPEAWREFLAPSHAPMEVDEIPGVRFYVLGPPENRDLLERSNPSSSNPETYSLFSGAGADSAFFAAVNQHVAPDYGAGVLSMRRQDATAFQHNHPFEERHRIPLDSVASHGDAIAKFYKAHTEGKLNDWRQIDNAWLDGAGQLALKLDSDTNNTSLVLAIELTASGKVLLFPGDAQVGNWLSWHQHRWAVNDCGGSTKEVTATDLLARTVLYKAGHHGSHNATMRDKGLELMTSSELAAMIPVSAEVSDKMDWHIPFDPLMDRLIEKTEGRILQADRAPAKPEGVLDGRWNRFLADVVQDDLFFDYTVKE